MARQVWAWFLRSLGGFATVLATGILLATVIRGTSPPPSGEFDVRLRDVLRHALGATEKPREFSEMDYVAGTIPVLPAPTAAERRVSLLRAEKSVGLKRSRELHKAYLSTRR